jgi:hypothetical protein
MVGEEDERPSPAAKKRHQSKRLWPEGLDRPLPGSAKLGL